MRWRRDVECRWRIRGSEGLAGRPVQDAEARRRCCCCESLTQVGGGTCGGGGMSSAAGGSGEARVWLADQCKTLKHEGGVAVVRALHRLVEGHAVAEGCRVPLAYLEKRGSGWQTSARR